MADEVKVKKIREKINKLQDELNNLYQELREEELKDYNFEGKYIRRGPGYMFVTWQKELKNNPISGRHDMFFQGWGFSFKDGSYLDDNFVDYDATKEWYIPMTIFESEVKSGKIREVTREEMLHEWTTMCDRIYAEGMKCLNRREENYNESVSEGSASSWTL